LARAWNMERIPSPWEFDEVANWMQLPPKPRAAAAVPAWQDHVAAETER
jgi:hypothetical protein